MGKVSEFSFERLEVYNKAVQFADSIFDISDGFPAKLQFSLGEQLRRPALFIVNNLAEGSDKRFAKKKNKFYEYALDLARECIVMLTISALRDLMDKTSRRMHCYLQNVAATYLIR